MKKRFSVFFVMFLFALVSLTYGSDSFLKKGLKLYKQKKFLLAMGQFKKALSNPDSAPYAAFYLGNCYLNNGKLEKAASYYQQALDSLSDKELQAQVLINLGQTLHRKGDFENAVHYYRQAYELDSSLAQSFWLSGMAFYSLRNKASVIRSWENYLSLRPNGKESDHIRKALKILKSSNFTFPVQDPSNAQASDEKNKETILDIEGVLDQIQPKDKGKITDDELEDIVK